MKRMRNAIVASVGVVVMSAIIVPQPVWAQATRKGAAAPKLATEVEEITVVAQKREENIQETPLSVTALTGAALEERGVTDVYGITDVAPNVRVNSVGGNMHVGMRGVTQARHVVRAQHHRGRDQFHYE
ncbi:MAG: TonB-dependent receptor [Deltaproteobacteria bacterium]|nr:TonB-dependent receptor [Deltaproteobacteria bacterium]